MNFYDAAYLGALPFFLLPAAWKRMRTGKYRESLPAMFGRRTPHRPLPDPGEQRAWLHSVSVGETVAAGALYRELRERRPGWEFLCSTTTETGQAQARETLSGAENFTYAPVDFSWTVRHFHRAWKPSLYLFFETEIWPNNLAECGRRGLRVFLVNGKLSERSGRRYAKFARLFRPHLAHVDRFFMQTPQDAERMARVLGGDDRIEVSGNIKFDALPKPLSGGERAAFREKWGAGENEVVFIAGSTHPGEEELIARSWLEVDAKAPGASRLVVVPRHPERFGESAALLEKIAGPVHRTSNGTNPEPGERRVVLLDEMRVLARAYGGADVALCAGSWTNIGGHNLLEAAIHGIPVLRGPHMQNQPEITRILGPEKGAPLVTNDELPIRMLQFLQEPEERMRLGALGKEAAGSCRGAAGRVGDRILEVAEAAELR